MSIQPFDTLHKSITCSIRRSTSRNFAFWAQEACPQSIEENIFGRRVGQKTPLLWATFYKLWWTLKCLFRTSFLPFIPLRAIVNYVVDIGVLHKTILEPISHFKWHIIKVWIRIGNTQLLSETSFLTLGLQLEHFHLTILFNEFFDAHVASTNSNKQLPINYFDLNPFGSKHVLART